MPPKRRRAPRAPEPEPEPGNSPPPPPDHSPSPSEDQDQDEPEPDHDHDRTAPPFYNTTFTAHRVSPLYLGSEQLTPNRLQLLAQRLRDRLVGDVVRGVEVNAGGIAGAGENGGIGTGRAGALEGVDISWVGVAEVLGVFDEEVQGLEDGQEEEGEDGDGSGGGRAGGTLGWRRIAAQLPGKRALHIALRYELASCTALLLPPLLEQKNGEASLGSEQTQFTVGAAEADEMDWESSADPARFLSLPLLLLRMPTPLKTVVADFLAATFDCRVSTMRLGTRSLVRSWEAWIRSAGLPSRGPLAKDVVLSLGFYIPPPERLDAAQDQTAEDETAAGDQQQPLGIKSIDVIIPAAELKRFVASGKRLAKQPNKQPAKPASWGWEADPKKRRKLAGRLYEEGWEWRTLADTDGSSANQPFTEALASYLKEHLGLNLFHPGVRITKMGCGGFVISETRFKLFAPAGSGAAEGHSVSWLGQRGAVLELIAGLIDKAQVQTVPV